MVLQVLDSTVYASWSRTPSITNTHTNTHTDICVSETLRWHVSWKIHLLLSLCCSFYLDLTVHRQYSYLCTITITSMVDVFFGTFSANQKLVIVALTDKWNSSSSSRTESDCMERRRGTRERKPKVHFDVSRTTHIYICMLVEIDKLKVAFPFYPGG